MHVGTQRREEDGPPWNHPGRQTDIVSLPAAWGDNTYTSPFFTREEAVWTHYAIQRLFLATNADCSLETFEALQSRQGWQELFGDTGEHPPTIWDLLEKTCLRRQTAEFMEAETLRNLGRDNKWDENTVSTQVARVQAWFCQVTRFFDDESVSSEPMRNPHVLIFLHALWEVNQGLGIGG